MNAPNDNGQTEHATFLWERWQEAAAAFKAQRDESRAQLAERDREIERLTKERNEAIRELRPLQEETPLDQYIAYWKAESAAANALAANPSPEHSPPTRSESAPVANASTNLERDGPIATNQEGPAIRKLREYEHEAHRVTKSTTNPQAGRGEAEGA